VLEAQEALAEVQGAFDPSSIEDARERVMGSIVRRRGQQAFREALIQRYGGRCLVTGCDVVAVLEAAHIVPYQGEETNHPENGLLLRADSHTLFDLGLLAVDEDFRVVVHSSLHGSSHGVLHGQRLLLLDDPQRLPSLAALATHRTWAGLGEP
jgi:predicted restriction endonuclease